MKQLLAIVLFVTSLPVIGQTVTGAPSTLYVYRAPAKLKGRMLKPAIYCDGVVLSHLRSGTYFTTTIPAGRHIITLGRSEVGQFVEMESGKEYFFRFGHKNMLVTGLSGAEPLTLTPVTESVARPEMDGLKNN